MIQKKNELIACLLTAAALVTFCHSNVAFAPQCPHLRTKVPAFLGALSEAYPVVPFACAEEGNWRQCGLICLADDWFTAMRLYLCKALSHAYGTW